MDKQFNVNLAFTADTSKARQQLQDLQKTLNGLTASSAQKSPFGITDEINKAIGDVTKLEVALKNATTHTGSLDLGQFRKELNKAGLDAEQIADRLATLGPEGKQAFAQLTQSIVTAEVPLKRTSALLSEFAVTLKNTARWQISSSILHGFMGSLQSAYHYAEDLNESLNNIRIVTGKSSEEMAAFAKEANSAAKALSTTTTKYTDASLIYYQQGLSDSEVKERTDVTVKMANVARESAEDVSQQMTAVWNNFYDGSKSLEYYADAMTALGAATASSTDEIAEGLEKFAAVADTVGLSYEYATSALATVTATTRQSADIVGNAFKTLFARIEGLNLGETLEDGTDLNKYSQALAAVGVNIKDTNGDMKDMDQILDELGSKWQTLAKDEQVALAQTVAGARQYTQMIALMNNWDFFQENLGVVKDSEGTLQKQADIYAESWEAARDRVTAALQEIYEQLLDDDFFIDLLNAFEKIIETVSHVIDAFGGLKGVIPLLGTIMLKAFGPDLANSINNIKTNIQLLSKSGKEAIIQQRMDMVNALRGITDDSTYQGAAQSQVFDKQAQLQEEFIRKSVEIESVGGKIAEREQEQVKHLMDLNTELGKAYVNAAKERDAQEDIAASIQNQVRQKLLIKGSSQDVKRFNDNSAEANSLQQQFAIGNNLVRNTEGALKKGLDFKEIQKSLTELKENLDEAGIQYTEFESDLEKVISAKSLDEFLLKLRELSDTIDVIGGVAEISYSQLSDALIAVGIPADQAEEALKRLADAHYKAGEASYDEAQKLNNLNQNAQQTGQTLRQLGPKSMSLGTAFVTAAQGISTFAMVLSSIKGLIDTINNDSLSPFERFVTILTTMGMIFPMIVTTVESFAGVMKGKTAATIADTAATKGAIVAQKGLNAAIKENPVGAAIAAIMALITALVALGAWIDWVSKSGERAAQDAQDAVNTYNETKTALKKLNEELETTQSRLQELHKLAKKGPLSISDQKELAQLEAKNAQLEAQIELKKQLLAADQSQVASKAKEAFEKDSYNIDSGSKKPIKKFDEPGGGPAYTLHGEGLPDLRDVDAFDREGYQAWLDAANKLLDQAKTKSAEYEGHNPTTKYQLENWAKTIESQINIGKKTWEEGNKTAMADLTKGYEAAMKYLPTLYAQDNKALYGDTIDYYENIVAEWYKVGGTLEETSLKAFESAGVGIKDLNAILDKNKSISDLTAEQQQSISFFAQTVGLDVDTMITALRDWDGEIVYSTSSTEESAKALSKVSETAWKLAQSLKEGDSISPKDYNELDVIQQTYFSKMLDGTYKMTGDAEEFYNLVHSQKIDEAQQQKVKLLKQNKQFTEIQGYDWDTVSTSAATDKKGGYDTEVLEQQLNLLEQLNPEIKKQTDSWRQDAESKTLNARSFKKIAKEVQKCQSAYDNLSESIEKNNQAIYETDLAIALSYDNYDDLRQALDDGTIGAQAFTKAEEEMLEASRIEGLDTDEIEEYADYLQDTIPELENNAEGAEDLAIQIKRMDKGIDELANNWEDWNSILQNSAEGSEEYCEALSKTREAMSDLLDISEDFISQDMIKENAEDITAAAEGDADAIDRLRAAALDDIIVKVAHDKDSSLSVKGLTSEIDNLQSMLDSLYPEGITMGTSINDAGFIDACNNMILAAGMSADEVNALFSDMGYNVNFAEQPQKITTVIPEYTTHHEIGKSTTVTKDGIDYETFDENTWTEQTGEHRVEGETTAFAMQTSEPGTTAVPKINSISKKATGSSNNYSSSNRGGTKSAGGKSTNNHSKKNSNTKKSNHKNHTKDKINKYYDINNAISKVNQQLERNEQLQKKLGSMQSHYAGKTLIKSLKQENELLKQKNDLLASQYANYQKTYSIQSQELKELKKKLGGKWNGNELQNYSQLFQENVNRYNAAIDAYNAMSAEQQKASGKQMIEDAKTAYDEYKKALERYQDLYYNEMYDTENKLADVRQQKLENQLKQIENNLKAWEIDIQLKLDKTEAERDLNDFFKKVEQDFRKVFKDLTLDSAFDTKNFNTSLEDAETYIADIKDTMAEIDRMEASKDADGVVQLSEDMRFGSISEAQEYLKKLQGELVGVGNSLNDMYKQVWDNYIEGLDQAADNFEDINDEFEHLTDELEYEKELIELVYGDKAYDLMDKYYETQQKNINEQIESTRTQAEFWENQFKEAYNMNKDKHNVDLNDMSTWTEDMEKAYDKMISSQEKLNDLILEGIKNLRDEYLNNVAKTLSDMDKAVWGMDFEDVKEDWDFIQKRADEYLDDVEGAYQIQTLANKIDTSIAETSSLKAQQKLAALREEEIEYLREKENLTQDDIDLAEARYQIALKEIALEDAQNNKTSMKLNRDESGNWTYQYVADEEDTSAKQQELLDAYNNLYETADNAYNHALELAMNTYEEYREKLNDLAEDVNLTEEEKYIKMQELRDMYLPEMTAAMENANIYEQETIYATGAVFSEVCKQDADAYYTLTDLQKALVDEVKGQNLSDYGEIRNAILNNYGEIGTKAKDTFSETNENSKTNAAAVIDQWDGKKGSVKTSFQEAFDNIIKYTQDFEKELGVLEQVSNKEITNPNGVVDDFDKTGNKIDEVGGKTQNMATTAEENLDKMRGFVTGVEQAWQQVVIRIREAINALQGYIAASSGTTFATSGISGGGGKLGSNTGSSSSGSGSAGVGSSNSGGGNTGNGSPNGGSSQSGVSIPTVEGIAGNIWIYGEWGDDPTRHALFKEKFGKTKGEAVYNAVQALFNSGYGYGYEPQHDWDYYRKFGPSAYKTGGYTGEWDSSGKLAILHEKELVLNAEDTSNMLNAVRTVRDIAGLNDSISETIASSIGQLVLGAMAATPNSYNTSSNENANNIFNITAEFPNADDVQTIRDAILSLPNIASQFIHES